MSAAASSHCQAVDKVTNAVCTLPAGARHRIHKDLSDRKIIIEWCGDGTIYLGPVQRELVLRLYDKRCLVELESRFARTLKGLESKGFVRNLRFHQTNRGCYYTCQLSPAGKAVAQTLV